MVQEKNYNTITTKEKPVRKNVPTVLKNHSPPPFPDRRNTDRRKSARRRSDKIKIKKITILISSF